MKRTLLVVVTVALAVAIGWRFTTKAQAKEKAEPSNQPQSLRVVTAQAAPEQVSIWLPASVRPREHVVLYARTNGFLKQWKVDLGDVVKKGQVLGLIDAPEVVANLAQSRSRLDQAKASITLVKSQHERTKAMTASGTLTPQDLDTSALRLAAAESELVTAGAEVDRLSALVGFQTVVAPFDGTISRRYLDNGALVQSGQTAMFEIASTSDMRVDLDVPQWLASQVHPGTPATVTIGKSAKVYTAEVSRTAGALDPVLRTLGIQLTFKDAPPPVVPGSYAKVKLDVPRGEPALTLPGAALGIRNGTSTVGVVRADGTLHFVPVRLVRDLGRDIEVQGELQLGQKVALFPPPELLENDRVTPVEGKP